MQHKLAAALAVCHDSVMASAVVSSLLLSPHFHSTRAFS